MKILIVDDSRAMRMLVTRALRQAGFGECEIVEASGGDEAVGMVHRESPDLVLSDWNMPAMLGVDLLRKLRAEGNGVRFGFVTSEVSDHIKEEARVAGAEFVISKPFAPDAFARAINR